VRGRGWPVRDGCCGSPTDSVERLRNVPLLGAFAKLLKATISIVMSVCPFVRMEQLGSHWTDFHEICYLSILRKSVDKIQVSVKCDKNNGQELRWSASLRSE